MKKEDWENLPQFISEKRKEKGLSKKYFLRNGITIRSLENKEQYPRTDKFAVIGNILDLDYKGILTDEAWMDPKQMSVELWKIRKSRGLTQKKLGDMSDVSSATIADYESGRHTPSLKTIVMLNDALGLELWEN